MRFIKYLVVFFILALLVTFPINYFISNHDMKMLFGAITGSAIQIGLTYIWHRKDYKL